MSGDSSYSFAASYPSSPNPKIEMLFQESGAATNMPTTRSQTSSSAPVRKTKTKITWSNCTASTPQDPRAGLCRPKTAAALRKAFWAGSTSKPF
jgi:hypothetical protein